jgi:hypothetical protein
VLGRTLVYFNCEVAPLLEHVAEVNPNVNLLIGLLKPPNRASCQSAGILKGTAASAHQQKRPTAPAGKLLGGLTPAFGSAPSAGSRGGR